MSGRRRVRLWGVVRRIIRENHELLRGEFQRDSYYIVRDLLTAAIGSDVSQDEFDWFLTDQGYRTYRDDVWTSLEQREGLERPLAKPEGWFYDRGDKRPIEQLPRAWGQNRGWIFVEKAGEAEKIKSLSLTGWGVVVAGRGFPTRLLRDLVKAEDKPVLVFHDADRAGTGIYRVFGEGSRRTRHLDLIVGKARDLGLRYEDAERLDLPWQPEPPKYRGEPRYEISALSVLRARMGVDNPTLAYVKARMLALGILIAPTEVAKADLWRREALFRVDRAVIRALQEAVRLGCEARPVEEGTAVDVETGELRVRLPDLDTIVLAAVDALYAQISWSYEGDWHAIATEGVPDELVRAVGGDGPPGDGAR